MTRFFVPGLAVPGGSKRAFPVRGRDGRVHLNVADTSGRKGVEWRAAIRLAAQTAHNGALLTGAIAVGFEFLIPRPHFHLRPDGTVRPSAPPDPITRPDVLKLARAVEDSLTGVLWADDAQIISEHLDKRYTEADEAPGVAITVRPLGSRQAALALAAHDP